MFKKLIISSLILFSFFSFSCGQYHADMKNTAIHVPYRWIWADSAARAAQSVIGRDTCKIGIQVDDYSVWYLSDTTAPTWNRVSSYKSDSIYSPTGIIDTLTSDSIYASYGAFDILKTDSLIIRDTTVLCTSFVGSTPEDTISIRYSIIGNVVTIRIPYTTGTCNGSENFTIRTLPDEITPSENMRFTADIMTGSANQVGHVRILTNSTITVYQYDNSYLGSGTCGLGSQPDYLDYSFTYPLN